MAHDKLLQIIKQKSNLHNQTWQRYQHDIKGVFEEALALAHHSVLHEVAALRSRMSEVLAEYSLSLNQVELDSLNQVTSHMQSNESTDTASDTSELNGDEVVSEDVHKDERPFKCELCPSDFRKLQGLYGHICNVHNLDPYECDECDATFRRKVDLKTHCREKHNRLGCTRCGSVFSAAMYLKQHMQRVHAEPQERSRKRKLQRASEEAPQVKRRRVSDEEDGPGPGSESESELLLCRCCTRRDDLKGMIWCRWCDAWFHFACAGLSKQMVISMDAFKCSFCANLELDSD